MIRPRTTPTIDIAEIDQALCDEELLARSFQDAVLAMGRYAVLNRSLFHATLLLDEIRAEFDKKAGQP